MAKGTYIKAEECKGVWVFVEIQNHERVLEGALEILSHAGILASGLGEKTTALLCGLDAEQYIPEVEQYGPDEIVCISGNEYKHYDSETFPDVFEKIIIERKPSVFLFPATEAGRDLAPRLAERFSTGLTSHCCGLEILSPEDGSAKLLLMKRPAFSGNMLAAVICPEKRPQMATVQQGLFKKKKSSAKTVITHYEPGDCVRPKKITGVEAPLRWDPPDVPLEKADIVIAGGAGMGSAVKFSSLFELAEELGGEVGATRIPVFNEWADENRMIGQTGKTISPRLYMGFGISGQLQHTAAVMDSEIIVSVNTDKQAPLNNIADYVINEDAASFACELARLVKNEKSRGKKRK